MVTLGEHLRQGRDAKGLSLQAVSNATKIREHILASLESVSAVFIFDSPAATDFLAIAGPDIYVKGGDYTLETLNQQERGVVEKAGGRIAIIPFVPGKSTTATLAKISKL